MAILSIAGVAVAGLVAYRLRCRSRFWYGLVEIGIALLIVESADFSTVAHRTVPGPAAAIPGYWIVEQALTLSAAVYVLVRGLDNVAQDLPESWRPLWDSWFGKSPAPNSAATAEAAHRLAD